MSAHAFEGSVVTILKERGRSAWDAATNHPMVREIGAGTLPHETFRYYFEQNILYLEEYARSIAFIASRAPDHDAIVVLNRFLSQIAEHEIPANHAFLRRLGGSPDRPSAGGMAALTYAYTRHLLSTVSQCSPAAGLAAILPCQWSYGEIGTRLAPDPPDDQIYADWIALFSEPGYDDLVADSVRLLDRLAAAEAVEIGRLSSVFDWSTRYELGFWEMAYTRGAVGGTVGAVGGKRETETTTKRLPTNTEETL